jgi:hypothetical protein
MADDDKIAEDLDIASGAKKPNSPQDKEKARRNIDKEFDRGFVELRIKQQENENG